MRKRKISLAAVVLSLGMTGIVSTEEVKPLSDPDNIYKDDRVEETINPVYFWPKFPSSFALSSSNDVEENENVHVHVCIDYDNPDFFFDQILIDYVGEKEFDKWFYSLDISERTVTKLKSDFNISDEEVEKIFEIAEEKAKEKAKRRKKS
ncbi:hypothetical protein NDK47_07370 [Brevibacillus ruminantium]|uniref:Uncharacterized protein n=1 Tax=Brevibacillus ruminantium TaxID=2950604 RepID=A0ABY4WLU0_9BACL|nr:hypothetical protein [Brevibacillus ruminantium]USG67103.1 hypothetical protein NDK47_07370 [Brevibacillus ruminantium]